jgi:hypothetical protein
VSVSLLPAPSSDAATAVETAGPAPESSIPFKREDQIIRLWRWVNRFEWFTVLLIAILAVGLHIRFVTHVGGLWRDEANSAHLATLPTFGELWHFLDYDSFPIVFFAVLRAWLGVFGSDNDVSLRTLGCIIGLGILCVLWINARAFGTRWPVLSLALIGLNPMLIRYGDSTRAYGLGMILILLTFGSFWRLLDSASQPSLKRVVTATALALLSVQCLYYNSVLLFAIAAGAVAVAVRARAWRTVSIVLSIGTFAAASLLPYVPMMRRMREWTFLVSHSTNLAWLWKRSCEVIGAPDPLGIWLWAALFIGGLGVVASFAIARFLHAFFDRQSPTGGPSAISAAVLFAAVALAVGVAAYAGFLRILNYYTAPWYYITLAAFAACALDIVFGAWPIAAKLQVLPLVLRGARLAAALLLLCLAGLPTWEEMPTRHTNVDLLATRLQLLATKGDLILVPRWECAITLCRYYRGPAEIISLPPIEDHRFHRYDLLLRQMMTTDPLRPVFARLEEVLRSGHRIFLAGALPLPRADFSSHTLPPAYRDPSGGWHGAHYDVVWQLQAAHFLRSHAMGGSEIQVSVPGRASVQGFENLDLGMVAGWR